MNKSHFPPIQLGNPGNNLNPWRHFLSGSKASINAVSTSLLPLPPLPPPDDDEDDADTDDEEERSESMPSNVDPRKLAASDSGVERVVESVGTESI